MHKFLVTFLALASVIGCQSSVVTDFWLINGIDYSDYDAAQDRFAVYAEKAVAAPEADAAASVDALFDMLAEDEVAYYIYTDWIDAAFYNPCSSCRNAALYSKAVDRILADGVLSERECSTFLRHKAWIGYNSVGSDAVMPGFEPDGRRTLVLVLNISCRSCREALSALDNDPQWKDVRRIALGFGYGQALDVPGWEYGFLDNAADYFDPDATPVFFVVSPEGKVELPYQLL